MNLLDSSPSAARCGKIARLPLATRDALNRRLENNEPAGAILPWLNNLPETKLILAAQFQNAQVTPQNLSEWRQGGFREWLLRRELIQHAESLNEAAGQIRGSLPAPALADNLAVALVARYAALLNSWDGSITPEFENQLRVLRTLNHDIIQLQKSLHRAAEQNLKQEQARAARAAENAAQQREEEILPVSVALDVENFTRVYGQENGRLRAAFSNHLTLEEVNLICPPPSNPIVPNPTQSNQTTAAPVAAPRAAAAPL